MKTVTTSSRNYNILALRGAQVDDMEYVETFGLDPAIANTPQLNEVMLDRNMQENIDAGMDEKKAKMSRDKAARNIKSLLAKNGMLK